MPQMTSGARVTSSELDALQRRASARAQAATLLDTTTAQRDFRVLTGRPLHSTSRRRMHSRAAPRRQAAAPGAWHRQRAVAVLVVELVALAALLWLPLFSVGGVQIAGNRLLTSAAVLDAADVPHRSIFAVDPGAIRQRLLQVPWIRSATVTTQFPNVVRIRLTEWTPIMRLHRRGSDTLVADSGATLPASAGQPLAVSKIPVLVDERSGRTQPLDPQLVQTLDTLSSRFPTVFGCSVAAYEWRPDGIFLIWTSTGWSAVLGHLDTGDQVAGIAAQMTSLAALAKPLNFKSPSFGYVDLENVAAPAVGGAPGLPAAVRSALVFPAQVPVTPAAPKPLPQLPPALPSPSPTAAGYVFYIKPSH